MRKKLEEEIKKLETIQKKNNDMINCAPDGKIRCAINKGYYQYYSGNKYLGSDKKNYIKQVIQKEYCVKLNKKLEQYICKLKELQELYKSEVLEDVYRNLHLGRKQFAEPLVIPIEKIVEDFENLKYDGKEFSDDNETAYYTIKNERVRSKSEKIIADELYKYDIPYKYEMPIELWDKKRKIRFYPDFTVLNKRSGNIWYIEHLGLMDKTSYFENAMQKLDIYEKNRILIGKNLLLLHETANHPLDVHVMREYIENFLC